MSAAMAQARAAELTGLTAELVAIDSVNPTLVAGGAGEAAVAAFVAAWLSRAGLEVEVLERTAGRPSVVGTVRGHGSGRSLMLNAHLDTVGFGGMDQPLRPRIEGDRLHGRGAHDMKSGLAVALAVAAEVAKAPLAGDLVVAAVADEEAASVGTSEVLGHVRTDGAIVTEPTGLDIVRAHGGFVWLELDVRGRAAHGSQPADGVDAIVHAALILAELPELSRTLARAPGHELLGPGSLHAGTIAGGVEPSSYPARCRVELERRLVPGETVGGTLAEIEALIATVRARVPELDATVSVSLERPPFVSPPDGLLLQTLAGAATAAGRSADVTGHRAWMDASLLSRAGIDCVVYGPLGHGAHADVEWVDIPSLTTCADTVLRTAREYCR